MKKSLFLLLVVAILTVLCVPAFAAYEEFSAPEPFAVEPDSSGVLQGGAFTGPQTIPGEAYLMDSNTEILYNRILQGMQTCASSIPLEDFWTTDMDWLQNTFETVVNDHPELFYANWFTPWGYSDRFTSMEFKYSDLSYYGYSDLRQAIDVFNAAVDRALAVVDSGMSDVEKALALHDYLVMNCAYNWDVAASLTISYETYVQFWNTTPNKMLATTFGALVNGDPICQSYSLAYKLLLNRVGIDCITIGSEDMHHVWNGVKLDGKWYQTDVTWDDPTPNTEGSCMHVHFLISDESFANSHHDWEQKVVCSDKSYESGWVFSGSGPICRWNGKYYYTADNGNLISRLLSSETLRLEAEPTVLCDNTGAAFYGGYVWNDGYVYFVPYAEASVTERRLVRCSLDTGKLVQIGGFSFTATASPDGAYSEVHDTPCLRCNKEAREIEIVSRTRRTVDARFPIPPDTSAWEAQAAGRTTSIAGLTDDKCTAGIFWGSNSPKDNLTFIAAYYRDGRMVAARPCTVPAAASWAERTPVLKLMQLDQQGIPRYDEIRLMLVDADSLRPVCPAV